MSTLRPPSPARALALLAALSLALAACGEEIQPAAPPSAAPAGPYDEAGGLTDEGRWKQLIRATLPPRPHVVIVVLQELRGDRCGEVVAGAAHELTPRLAAFAESGDAFLHAVTPCPEPAAALASLLTGLSPARHGVSLVDPVPRLDLRHVTLGEILAAVRGYATRAFVGDARLAQGRTLWQGFSGPFATRLDQAAEAIAAWRAEQPAGTPTCALLVADECTAPYGPRNHAPHVGPPRVLLEDLPPEAVAEEALLGTGDGSWRLPALPASRQAAKRWLFEGHRSAGRADVPQRARAAYDEGVAWADGLLGALLERVASDSLVVVTSTGGTAFGEHGVLGAGRDLHDEQVRVPLVFGGNTFLKGEGGWTRTASLVDVLPTLLDLLELPALPDASGVSLRPVLLGELRRGPVVSQEEELPANTGVPSAKATLVSVRSPSWKYLVRFDVRAGTVVERAYDLSADPEERKDLAVDGVASAVGFDEAFCEAVERVRDGLWTGGIAVANRLAVEAYAQGERVLTERPAPCKAK